ncbi:hypothetical protein KKB28_06190 [bacterium]|nr:hypothetical protein [bacterium]
MKLCYRKIAFLFLLVVLFWALAQARHNARQFQTAAYSEYGKSSPEAVAIERIGIENAACIDRYPFVALDNTCRHEISGVELWDCTGLISSQSAIGYKIAFNEAESIFITVRPIRDDFDIAVGLFRADASGELFCVVGKDTEKEGWAERIRLVSLPAGVYYIVIGGYGTDCGMFEFSVELNPLIPVSLQEFTIIEQDSGTVVRWKTDFEADLHHFRLYRVSDADGTRQRIFQPRSRGSFSKGARYEFFDRDARAEQRYVLAGIDVTGKEFELRKESL